MFKKFKLIYAILFKIDKELLDWFSFVVKQKSNDSVPTAEQRKFLKKGTVVWVDFGQNLGDEFSGYHPALILRAYRNGRTAYFIPIDSGHIEDKAYCINVPQIYGYKNAERHINAYRTQCLSTCRIDFNNKIGHIDDSIVNEVDIAIKKYHY